MSARSILRLTGVGVVAAGLTAGLYTLDRQRADVQETITSLQWARQVVTQVESLELRAREREEADPLNWAIDYLAQGPEPRLIRISRLAPEAAKQQLEEVFELRRKEGVFDYSKILDPETSKGIRVQLDVGSSGILSKFLGTRTRLTHDLAVGTIFGLLWFALLGMVGWRSRPRVEKFEAPEFAEFEKNMPLSGDDIELLSYRSNVITWFDKAKEAFVSVTGDVRDLIKHANDMTKASHKSRENLAFVKEKIHSHLTEIHEARVSFRKTIQWVTQAEALAQSSTSEQSTRLTELIIKLRDQAVKQQEALENLEMQIEPLATDADIAFATHDEILTAAEKMTSQIETTRHRLKEQAELVRNFEKDLGSKAPREIEPALAS